MEEESAAAVHDYIRTELVDLGVEEDTISASMRLDELDVDSLDVADLIMSIKKNYGVDIPRRDLIGITLAQLVERVVSEGAARSA